MTQCDLKIIELIELQGFLKHQLEEVNNIIRLRKLIENKEIKIVQAPNFFSYNNFVNNTCIATSTIILNKKVIGKLRFPNIRLCEDYVFKCNLLKKFSAFNLCKANTYYRIRKNSLQSYRLRVLFAVWKINRDFKKKNSKKKL